MALTARVAVVTGANQGIGREIARQLARQGLQVVLTARDARAAQAVAAEFSTDGLTVQPHQLDVTDATSAARLAADLERVDVLVNNAGAYYDTDDEPSTADLAIVQAALDVHLLGLWRLYGAFIPGMRARRYGRPHRQCLQRGRPLRQDGWNGQQRARLQRREGRAEHTDAETGRRAARDGDPGQRRVPGLGAHGHGGTGGIQDIGRGSRYARLAGNSA